MAADPMIRLTRMNQQPVVLNADLIVSVESLPDTLVTLMNGDRIHVLETVDQVVDAAIAYRRRVLTRPAPVDGG